MEDIFEYYLENCQSAYLQEGELIFEFVNHQIIYSFGAYLDFADEEAEELFYELTPIAAISDITHQVRNAKEFTQLRVEGFEYLGDREVLEVLRSISNEMFFLIKHISSFDNNLITKYKVDIDEGDPYCSTPGNYIFVVEIAKEVWWNIEFSKFIVYLINEELDKISLPDFYLSSYQKNKRLKDDKLVPIVSTNTKIRRLGYFKVLSLFLEERKKVPENSINKRFEDFCSNFQELLGENKFKKGLISQSKSGISAKPYIDIAYDFGFLNKINNIVSAGKSFKVYQELRDNFGNSANIFKLNEFDKVYFLEVVLRNDYFYFSNLMRIFFLFEKLSYNQIIKLFKDQLIESLKYYKECDAIWDRKMINGVDEILKRIMRWEKAEIYLEHIIQPRINWMLDLEIVEMDDKEYVITEVGLSIYKNLLLWNDINTYDIMSSDAFLDRYMIQLFDDCYQKEKTVNPTESIVLSQIYVYINKSFDLFKTLSPNRVTASQAINYTKYQLYFLDKIKVDYTYILDKLFEMKSDNLIFKYQEQYQDGYLQKKI